MPDDAVLERTRAFDPASLSAREARRFVRLLLEEAGRDEWAEAAELAVSEVVTNVVLHAHTPFDLTVRLEPEHVRVEVRDSNPTLPQQRAYDDQATTGRGMALVEAVTDAHGITALGAEGKVVWFCVGSAPADGDPLAAWSDADEGWEVVDAPDHAPERTVDVVLPAMPSVLWLAARQHHDALVRELVLHCARHPECGISSDQVADADAARSAISSALTGELARARLDSGRPQPDALPSIDLVVPVPVGSGHAFATLQDVLDTAERLAAGGDLLVPPGLPEVVAVRDWACEQVISQLAGGVPAPWPGTAQERFTTAVHGAGAPSSDDWDVAAVRDSARAVVAADEANRILAVSRPLATALGYEPDELVGRRVVTLVPARYREAHVAGFTRHLATGESHVLGRDLHVPVLRRDGSELDRVLRLETTGTSAGRRVYLAEFTPSG